MSHSKVVEPNLVSKNWVVGEVLVDLIPSVSGDTKFDGATYKPVVGGGPANTARAMAKWGVPTSFIGGFSSDRFGHIAWSEMSRDGVDLDLALESDLPTAKAIVDIGTDGGATYRFEVESTATFDFRLGWLPKTIPALIHIGSLATVVKPGADVLFDWLYGLKGSKQPPIVLFDPNVRKNFLQDSDRYRDLFERWITLVDVVKASDEDLEFIYPNQDHQSIAHKVLGGGPSHLVLTCGDRGIKGFNHSEEVAVASSQAPVVDTVGAGDTVGAVVASAVATRGIDSLLGSEFHSVLALASRAAAITCSRQGANPPTRDEFDGFWRS
jgi:fructokinase